MTKLVVINLGEGSLNQGFPRVTVQLWETNNSRPTQFYGGLPSAPEIYELYKRFKSIYSALYQSLRKRTPLTLVKKPKIETSTEFANNIKLDVEANTLSNSEAIESGDLESEDLESENLESEDLEIDTEGLTNVSESDFNEVCEWLCEHINIWLNSTSFRPIDRNLRSRLSLDEDFQVIIESNDYTIRRLPWHLWDFFEDYQKAEVGLSKLNYEQVQKNSQKNIKKVRILAILGNSQGIDVQQDRILLEQLPDASMKFLVEPSRRELDKWLWDKQGWDILFFAGHSHSQEDTGKIHINRKNCLTVAELKNALKYAIARGLKLAIFNSCDGLGLAKELGDLNIPQTIVMRENVPDLIAHEFLKNFLTSFAAGESLHLAVRYARLQLQGLEDNFPGASWLPVICQNPAEITPTWEELRGRKKRDIFSRFNRVNLQTALTISVMVTACLTGVRTLGLMQKWELSAFDSMTRIKPAEAPDKRILVITLTEADIQAQRERQKSSLSDPVLQELLEKLELHRPKAIGLDIYRDFSVDTKYPNLANRLRKNDNFFAICKASGQNQHSPGTSPPPEIPAQRVGFSDVVEDSDFVIRRQLISLTPEPDSSCKTQYSFSLQLAKKYLESQGIKLQFNNKGHFQFRDVVFKPIDVPTGGYQKFDSAGHQVLLNYRLSPTVGKQITLAQALNGDFNSDWIKNNIVLIGVEAESVRDTFLTPHGKLSGVIIHAHMVSQILSAVLDGRSLLWVWSGSGELIWIWFWSLLGGVIALYNGSQLQRSIFIGNALLTQFLVCFLLLLQGGWIPIVPSVLSFLITTLFVKIYTDFSVQKKALGSVQQPVRY
ncbi:CHASE2 domain-containing protein [Mastigocoleus sp. MO_188.B34]|uniref:CHASE2 domain-containing protein n=1 Tax=Mastigocoleus sp. MO_188.B34 TaxID=3036635 RepID=UPI002629A556|nr:CHASE2 domain-containing protein [Mastigocoleus sp. MO_188.B34]MDJ0693409.1 CHASE2 domain-containing protein [Mastigocoleus sp. MO_188.B34]